MNSHPPSLSANVMDLTRGPHYKYQEIAPTSSTNLGGSWTSPSRNWPKHCHICSKNGKSKGQVLDPSAMLNHLLQFHYHAIFTCAQCHPVHHFVTEVTFQAHLVIHNPSHPIGTPFTCAICAQPIQNGAALLEHLYVDHFPSAVVPSSVVVEQAYLTTHMARPTNSTAPIPKPTRHRSISKRSVNSRPTVECRTCKKAFSSNLTLKRHVDAFHPAPGAPTFTCDLCPLVYQTNIQLYQHKRSCHKKGGVSLTCKICGYNSTSEVGLRGHHLTMHNPDHSNGKS